MPTKPDSKTSHLHMRVHPEMKEVMRTCAAAQGMSVSVWVDQAIRRAIADQAPIKQQQPKDYAI